MRAYDDAQINDLLCAAIPEFKPLENKRESGATIVPFPAREARRTR